MIRGIPSVRAFGLGFAITIALGATVHADEIPAPAAPVVVPEAKPAPAPAAAPAKPEMDWARQGLYFGPAFGVADTDGGAEFGWALQVLYRAFRYGGFQLEYENLGSENDNSGDLDALYLGAMPILPVAEPFSLFLQGGYAFGSGDDGGVGGGGIFYDFPREWLQKYLPGGLSVRLDYKFFDFEENAHLVTAGIMYRFGFLKGN